jgi:hypothetical protein
MKKTLIAMTIFASVATSALAEPADDWMPSLWSFGYSQDSIIRCSSPDDRAGRNKLSSIYTFYTIGGPSWLFPNTVTYCPQAGIGNPVFAPLSQ